MRGLVMLVSSLWLGACVREEKLVERFVEDYCAARWSCGCESPGLTEVHCESTLIGAGEEAQAVAQDAGLEYDRECAKQWLRAVDEACTVQPQPTFGMDECGAPCKPYHGRKGKGEPCVQHEPWSDCAGHLFCNLAGECQDPCDGRRAGDPCGGDVPTTCAPGLLCGPEQVCGPPPAIGEPCAVQCAPGGTCNLETSTCEAAPGFGEPCSDDLDDCGRGLRCVDGVCDVGIAEVCVMDPPW